MFTAFPTAARRPRIRPAIAALLLALPCCFTAGLTHAAAPAVTLVFAYLGTPDSDVRAGAEQGVAEANAQGKFLGLHYELVTVADVAAARAANALLIVTDIAPTQLPTLATGAANMAVVNAGTDDDALRTRCAANLFHTLPSAAMRADAEKQWRSKHADSAARAHAWHASAEKYAGVQLNKRYSDRAGRPMSDQAWAGWAATKLASDLIARQNARDAATLLTALRGEIAFDGQKGVDLGFRANGQLRQPLLLVESDRIVGEAPLAGTSEHDLDGLGPAICSTP